MSKREFSLQIRILPHEIETFRDASRQIGLTVSAWARAKLLHAARIEAAQVERAEEREDQRAA